MYFLYVCVCVCVIHSQFQENAQLSARAAAQESVISGLREERKLWGQELALQGATLAQDRGRMEAQIESLTTEVKSLRTQQQVSHMCIRVEQATSRSVGEISRLCSTW